MAQASIEPSGAQSGAGFSSAVRSAFAAVASWFAGASAPASTGQPFAHQFWIDTTTELIKQRNSGNTAWITVARMNTWFGNALSANTRGEVLDADRTQYRCSADLLSVEGTLLTALSLTLDTNTTPGSVGGNCLDTGSWAANTWYSLWVICSDDGASRALLASLSTSSPTLPTGFTRKRRVGWARTTGTATNLWPLLQEGARAHWTSANPADHIALATTTSPATTYTDIDCSPVVPPGTRIALLAFDFYSDYSWSGSGAPVANLDVRVNGSTSGSDVVASILAAADRVIIPHEQPLDASRLFEYRIVLAGSVLATDMNLGVWGRGWLDNEQQ
jgi:hypothetical protein